MKHALVKWQKDLKGEDIRYKTVGWIHDEWQTEVIGSMAEAERVAEIQKDSIRWVGEELGFKCPLAGSGDIGLNWAETH